MSFLVFCLIVVLPEIVLIVLLVRKFRWPLNAAVSLFAILNSAVALLLPVFFR